jgi:hypothetical protein
MIKNLKKNLKGGDGYSMNLKPIGGLSGVSRYSNNYQPIYDGELLQNGEELLQNGEDGYSVNVSNKISNQPIYTRYTDEDMSNKCLTNQSGGQNCGCNSSSKNTDSSIFDLIKLKGGNNQDPIFELKFKIIKDLSLSLSPLSTNNLSKLIVNTYIYSLNKNKPLKSKQFGGYITELENIIAPLGKNNLIVLSSLLLLHYFAVESQEKKKINILKGGDPFISNLTNILKPLGYNALGSSAILVMLQQAFNKKTIKNNISEQKGGNLLKNLISPLGTNAFIACGLLIILEKLFTSKINLIKKNNNKLVGGKIDKKYEKLFNMIAPITFNVFAKKSFLEDFAKYNLKNKLNDKE